MSFFITQKYFFDNIGNNKYEYLDGNLCGITNIYIFLVLLGVKIDFNKLIDKALSSGAYDDLAGWKYVGLIDVFKFFAKKNNIKYKNISMFSDRTFKAFLFNIRFKNFRNKFIMLSVKFDENHLILLNKFENNYVYFSSVGTKKTLGFENRKILVKEFLKIYNGRGIVINL